MTTAVHATNMSTCNLFARDDQRSIGIGVLVLISMLFTRGTDVDRKTAQLYSANKSFVMVNT